MGGIVSSLTGQGGSGLTYNAAPADIQKAATNTEALDAYTRTTKGLLNQRNFLTALQAQNGIQNQSDVFNQQQGLANQLQGVANGTGPNPALAQYNQATGQNVAQQAALMAGQRGVGANAGLIARQIAQQGAGIQQQAAGQAATLQAQQQLAGMNALQQQQALLGNTAGAQVGNQANATTGYNQAAQSQQQNILNALAQRNQSNVASQGNVNSNNAQIQSIAARGQQGLFGGLMNGIGGVAGGLFKGGGTDGSSAAAGGSDAASQAGEGSTMVGGGLGDSASQFAHGGMVPAYAGGGQVQQQPNSVGSFLYGSAPAPQQGGKTSIVPVSSDATGSDAVYGGSNAFGQGVAQAGVNAYKKMADGGMVDGPQSNAGKFLFGSTPSQDTAEQQPVREVPAAKLDSGGSGGGGGGPNIGSMVGDAMGIVQKVGPWVQKGVNYFSNGSAAGDASSAGEYVGAPATAAGTAGGGFASAGAGESAVAGTGEAVASAAPVAAAAAAKGGAVPGKANVKGDSYDNDNVPALLSPGEVIIPRHIMESADPAQAAMHFVAGILHKQGMRK